jgi:hypothetical protein
MNENIIKKHFWNAWKNRVIIARTNDEQLWVSDINSLIAVNETDPVLESRKVFPRIPAAGESFWASKDNIYGSNGPNIETLIERTLKDDNKPLIPTEWHKKQGTSFLKKFVTPDNKDVFINVLFLDLLGDESEYQFFTADVQKTVLVKNNEDKLIALIMPIRETK